MKDHAQYSIELDRTMHDFLAEMTAKYALADVGKAARCLVNYARENPAQHDAIFAEVRCLEC